MKDVMNLLFFLAIQACKLTCLPGVIYEKDQETWLPTCNFAYFKGVYDLAKLYCLGHSFIPCYFYCGLVSKAFVHDKDFAGK